MVVISAKLALQRDIYLDVFCSHMRGRGIATFLNHMDSGYLSFIPCPLVPGTSPNRNLLKGDRQTTFQPPVFQTPPDTDTSNMLFLLRLLLIFAISVAALPPSPPSIDTSIAGRQWDAAGDLVERMDGLGKRDDPCTQYRDVCGRGKISPPENTD